MHLHNHTEYSMLDGAARIDELFKTAEQMGMPALATTDHGFVFGAYEFWKKAKKHGVKPIVGIEAYLTPGTARQDRTRVRWGDGGEDDVSGTGAYTHMTLLAQNTRGMRNLFRMASLASLEGHFYKPRMDRELLTTYGEGLIATRALKDRVEAVHDLPGVPEGTPGKVLIVTGLSWIRYRVRFDNGVELNLLDGHHLRPALRRR